MMTDYRLQRPAVAAGNLHTVRLMSVYLLCSTASTRDVSRRCGYWMNHLCSQGPNFGLKSGGTNSEGEQGAVGSQHEKEGE